MYNDPLQSLRSFNVLQVFTKPTETKTTSDDTSISNKLNEAAKVKTELNAKLETVKTDAKTFIKESLAPLVEGNGKSLDNGIGLTSVLLSPLTLPGGMLGRGLAKIINQTGYAEVSEKGFTKAGLLIGSFGTCGVAMGVKVMNSNTPLTNTPLTKIEQKEENAEEKKLADRIFTLRDQVQVGNLNKEEMEERRAKIEKSILTQVESGKVSQDFAATALEELSKAKNDLKLAPQKQKESFDKTSKLQETVLERSIQFNQFVLELSKQLPPDTNLGKIEDTLKQESKLLKTLNRIKEKSIPMDEKLQKLLTFKGTTNNIENLRVLDELKNTFSKGKTDNEKAEIKASIDIIKKYLDIEELKNLKLKKYSSSDEWEQFKKENNQLMSDVTKAFDHLKSLTPQINT